jgi:hypothetical protein
MLILARRQVKHKHTTYKMKAYLIPAHPGQLLVSLQVDFDEWHWSSLHASLVGIAYTEGMKW